MAKPRGGTRRNHKTIKLSRSKSAEGKNPASVVNLWIWEADKWIGEYFDQRIEAEYWITLSFFERLWKANNWTPTTTSGPKGSPWARDSEPEDLIWGGYNLISGRNWRSQKGPPRPNSAETISTRGIIGANQEHPLGLAWKHPGWTYNED